MATRTSTNCTLSAGSFFVGVALIFCAILPSNESKDCFQDNDFDNDVTNQLMPNVFPFWHNPCGKFNATVISRDLQKEVNIGPKTIERIIVLTNYAMYSAQILVNSFVLKTFHMDFTSLSDELKNITFEWLQQDKYMPKILDNSQLEKINIKNVTFDVYMGLQYLAVGLDQVVFDQEKHSLQFVKEFSYSRQRLRAILCEMSNTFGDVHSVRRDEMPKSYYEIAVPSCRLLRDWVILHEYFSGLKYTMNVFKYFKSTYYR